MLTTAYGVDINFWSHQMGKTTNVDDRNFGDTKFKGHQMFATSNWRPYLLRR